MKKLTALFILFGLFVSGCGRTVEDNLCKSRIYGSCMIQGRNGIIINPIDSNLNEWFRVEWTKGETVRICSETVEFGYSRIWAFDSGEQFTDYVELGDCIEFEPNGRFWDYMEKEILGELFYFQIHYKICPSSSKK